MQISWGNLHFREKARRQRRGEISSFSGVGIGSASSRLRACITLVASRWRWLELAGDSWSWPQQLATVVVILHVKPCANIVAEGAGGVGLLVVGEDIRTAVRHLSTVAVVHPIAVEANTQLRILHHLLHCPAYFADSVHLFGTRLVAGMGGAATE